jgi:ABC-2 type transport system ATP-binding protein
MQQRFHALLAEVAATGRTVFLSSHTLSEVERVADRVAILRHGRLVVVDTLDGLRAVAVRRLEVEVGGGEDAARAAAQALRRLEGVREASITHGANVVVAFEGSADAVVKTVARFDVRALRSRDDDLEEIFLRYYRGDGAAS